MNAATIAPLTYTTSQVTPPIITSTITPLTYTTSQVTQPTITSTIAPLTYTTPQVTQPTITSTTTPLTYTTSQVTQPSIAPLTYTTSQVTQQSSHHIFITATIANLNCFLLFQKQEWLASWTLDRPLLAPEFESSLLYWCFYF